jgi:hypothetical protein
MGGCRHIRRAAPPAKAGLQAGSADAAGNCVFEARLLLRITARWGTVGA